MRKKILVFTILIVSVFVFSNINDAKAEKESPETICGNTHFCVPTWNVCIMGDCNVYAMYSED